MTTIDATVAQQALECFEEIILHDDQHVSTAKKGAELLCRAIAQPVPPTVSDAIAPDAITVNLMRLVGLDKHIARECEVVVRQMFAAIAQPVPIAAVGAVEQDVARLDWLIQELEAPPWKPFWYASTSDYLVKARAAIDEAHGGAS